MSDDEIDPLAMALFGIRDHIRAHRCESKRGIGGHHFPAEEECALADIVRRYGDRRAETALAPARSALAAVREVAQKRAGR